MTQRPLPLVCTFRRTILLAAFLLAVAAPHPASAATITVNTFAQGSVAGCSLAEAIASINAGANTGGCVAVVVPDPYGTNDTIILPFGTYNFTVADNGVNGLPIITKSLTINGNGSTLARTLGNVAPFFRFIQVDAGPLTINGLTFSGGNVNLANGGAILANAGALFLTITNTTFANNTAGSAAFSGNGGAIDDGSTGLSTITGSSFTGNTAFGNGGAILKEGGVALDVTTSTFAGNITGSASFAGNGGAIDDGSTGSSTVNDNCFSGNAAFGSGGAVFSSGAPTMNAEDNWWGAANGPSEEGPGSGDGVSTNVDFIPFLTAAQSFCPQQPIPTLSEWAQLWMVGLLVMGGLLALRRTKRAVPTRPA